MVPARRNVLEHAWPVLHRSILQSEMPMVRAQNCIVPESSVIAENAHLLPFQTQPTYRRFSSALTPRFADMIDINCNEVEERLSAVLNASTMLLGQLPKNILTVDKVFSESDFNVRPSHLQYRGISQGITYHSLVSIFHHMPAFRKVDRDES